MSDDRPFFCLNNRTGSSFHRCLECANDEILRDVPDTVRGRSFGSNTSKSRCRRIRLQADPRHLPEEGLD
jgi:hypothetical protein